MSKTESEGHSPPHSPREPGHIDRSGIRAKRTIPKPAFASNADAALYWAQYGFKVLPIVSGEKYAAVKWAPWRAQLSPQSIATHWAEHPQHDVACILGDVIVLDADSPEAEDAILKIEARCNVHAKLVVKTNRGSHHYYQLAADAFARRDTHSTALHPDRIDILTGESCALLPPSPGKQIVFIDAACTCDLSIVGQDFVDAVFAHNGKPPPRPCSSKGSTGEKPGPHTVDQLKLLLDHISPECGYDEWLRVLMALFHETGGSAEGLTLADRWSSKGSTYRGIKEIETKWRSFDAAVSRPVTAGTLIKMAKDAGADVGGILSLGHDGFEPCEYTIVEPGPVADGSAASTQHPLAQYSLLGCVAELERGMVQQVPFLGGIALLGQATVIYAKSNTGKTLIVLYLIVEAIRKSLIDPNNLIYLNMDDNSSGLVEKLKLAEEYGFHMVADGHRGFEAKALRQAMEETIMSGTASKTIVVLDTLKKFVNTMDKGKSSEFARLIRRFVLKGGTVVALAHANKHPGQDGTTVYSGTTDIVDDFDCAYTVTTVAQQVDANSKVVEFTNIKRRGDVALTAAYSYALQRNISYHELLLTVSEVDQATLAPVKQAAEAVADADLIKVIAAYIGAGINTKMKLSSAAAERTGVSKRNALAVLDRYTGDDPIRHRWVFAVRERGAKVFELLARVAGPGTGDTPFPGAAG